MCTKVRDCGWIVNFGENAGGLYFPGKWINMILEKSQQQNKRIVSATISRSGGHEVEKPARCLQTTTSWEEGAES
jgi:hypothetical protein